MPKDLKLIVHYVHPPIPYRDHDWICYIDGEEERKHYGYGETAALAIKDFIEQYEEDLWA